MPSLLDDRQLVSLFDRELLLAARFEVVQGGVELRRPLLGLRHAQIPRHRADFCRRSDARIARLRPKPVPQAV
ncbi:Uncharacterized protein DAT39_006776 [Clarias magur]|uniref:Uncharacterized protein n=1 Tax=Clarias magur TaxID=1594786 RepID=A0A8J4UKN9_CLAMG|nr:Uncharacterized protein DAT39_006776 [Clarias magur]